MEYYCDNCKKDIRECDYCDNCETCLSVPMDYEGMTEQEDYESIDQ